MKSTSVFWGSPERFISLFSNNRAKEQYRMNNAVFSYLLAFNGAKKSFTRLLGLDLTKRYFSINITTCLKLSSILNFDNIPNLLIDALLIICNNHCKI